MTYIAPKSEKNQSYWDETEFERDWVRTLNEQSSVVEKFETSVSEVDWRSIRLAPRDVGLWFADCGAV